MINFTVGPVQSDELLRRVAYDQVPYFRTQEFSELMFENERLIKKISNASDDSRVVFITGSGTASMEATIINIFNKDDRLLIINGGSFGQRFVDICETHDINYDEIKLAIGKDILKEQLYKYDGMKYKGLLVNVHETSTGVLYNIQMISDFCKKNNIMLIVDAISSFLADPIDFTKLNISAMIISSQKALACDPGISMVVLSPSTIDLVNNNTIKSLYFDFKNALKNGERGQTPYTPAVNILRQINARLKQIEDDGGAIYEISRINSIASYFREKIKDLPLTIVSNSLSNAVTPLSPINVSAYNIFLELKNNYGIWVCPNGGDLKDKVFRVGHIGALTKEDVDILVDALNDMNLKGLL